MNWIHKLKSVFVKHPEEEQVIETIEEIMDEREERGDERLVDPDELLLLKNLFKLKDMRAGEIMIPRIDIQGVSVKASSDDLKKIIVSDKFTRMPVYDKTLDNIVGIVHAKDILCALFEGKEIKIKDLMMQNVLFVPPSIRALDLLREMQQKRMQMVVVVDEYGGTDGLITLEDLLEEIVGEIEDEHDALDQAPVLKQQNSDTISADARVYLEDLEKLIGPFVTDEEREADIDTIGGLVFHMAGRLPHRGEVVTHASGIRFQIVDLDSRHIKKVKISHFKAVSDHFKQTDDKEHVKK